MGFREVTMLVAECDESGCAAEVPHPDGGPVLFDEHVGTGDVLDYVDGWYVAEDGKLYCDEHRWKHDPDNEEYVE